MRVREERPGERVAVRSIFDVAMLEVPDLDATEVLVAGEEGRVLGAVAADPTGGSVSTGQEADPVDAAEVLAVAVRPGRRGQGLGTALVETAAERHGTLVAAFDPGVRPFYEALGFEIEETDSDDDRLRGVRAGSP